MKKQSSSSNSSKTSRYFWNMNSIKNTIQKNGIETNWEKPKLLIPTEITFNQLKYNNGNGNRSKYHKHVSHHI